MFVVLRQLRGGSSSLGRFVLRRLLDRVTISAEDAPAPRIGIRPPKTAGQALALTPAAGSRSVGFGRPGPPSRGLRSASSSTSGAGALVVDQDRRAGPGVAQVAGVGLARAEVGLVDPGAAVPVAGARRRGGSGRRRAAGGCGRRRSARPRRPSRGWRRPGRRPRARARWGRCARSRSAPGRAAARRPGRASGCSRAWRAASSRTTASKCSSLGSGSAPGLAVAAIAQPRGQRARRRAPARPQGRAEAAGALGGAEDVLLGVGAVRHLRGDVEPLGQQRRHRLVVLDAGRLLGPAGGDRPEGPGQQPVEPREPLSRACGSR